MVLRRPVRDAVLGSRIGGVVLHRPVGDAVSGLRIGGVVDGRPGGALLGSRGRADVARRRWRQVGKLTLVARGRLVRRRRLGGRCSRLGRLGSRRGRALSERLEGLGRLARLPGGQARMPTPPLRCGRSRVVGVRLPAPRLARPLPGLARSVDRRLTGANRLLRLGSRPAHRLVPGRAGLLDGRDAVLLRHSTRPAERLRRGTPLRSAVTDRRLPRRAAPLLLARSAYLVGTCLTGAADRLAWSAGLLLARSADVVGRCLTGAADRLARPAGLLLARSADVVGRCLLRTEGRLPWSAELLRRRRAPSSGRLRRLLVGVEPRRGRVLRPAHRLLRNRTFVLRLPGIAGPTGIRVGTGRPTGLRLSPGVGGRLLATLLRGRWRGLRFLDRLVLVAAEPPALLVLAAGSLIRVAATVGRLGLAAFFAVGCVVDELVVRKILYRCLVTPGHLAVGQPRRQHREVVVTTHASPRCPAASVVRSASLVPEMTRPRRSCSALSWPRGAVPTAGPVRWLTASP